MSVEEKIHLFVGFAVEADFEWALQEVAPAKRALFINGEECYLSEWVSEGQRYLGKVIGEKIEVAELALIEANIYSLLRKVVADYPYERHSLLLFPV